MLQLNVSALLRAQGIDQPVSYLVQKGMKYHSASRLLNRKVLNLTYDTIEQLCLLCHCTPNELFVWYKNADTVVPDNHPMYALQPKEEKRSPMERLRQLDAEGIRKVQAFLDGLEEK